MPRRLMSVHTFQRRSVAIDDRRKAIRAWQDRIRDPALTLLLVLELALVFLAAPLEAKGLPIARPLSEGVVFAVVVVVAVLSHNRAAIAGILLGLTANLASQILAAELSPHVAHILRQGGVMVTFSALSWVVSRAVYAPGRITFRRLQGAAVLYLNLATIFAAVFSLIRELNPAAFANLDVVTGGPSELMTMLYFSLTSLTTTGYGDIVPLDPFARSLANLESVIGQFYLAITVARLVTLELEDRRR